MSKCCFWRNLHPIIIWSFILKWRMIVWWLILKWLWFGIVFYMLLYLLLIFYYLILPVLTLRTSECMWWLWLCWNIFMSNYTTISFSWLRSICRFLKILALKLLTWISIVWWIINLSIWKLSWMQIWFRIICTKWSWFLTNHQWS